jgi:deoxyhypusine synthase
MTSGSMNGTAGTPAWPRRDPLRLECGAPVSALLSRMSRSAFQGRKLGEAFEVWKSMIDGESLVCLGLAGSLASAGLWPLVTWLVERGYVDLLVSTSANVTEDLLEQRGAAFYRLEPEGADDERLWREGFYRFYDHVVGKDDYDRMEDFTAGFFRDLAAGWAAPTIPGVLFMRELGRWLEARGLGRSIAATCARHGVPLFVPAAPDGPLAEGYRVAARRRPVVDFFRDYELALRIMDRHMVPGRGTSAVFVGGGVPKDFIQITATSVCAIRGGVEASPHRAAIQLTTDNAVFGGLGGASVASEGISWGKESARGQNVMVFADFTIALPFLCQGLLDHYGPDHVRVARGRIAADVAAVLDGEAQTARDIASGTPERLRDS